jgi:plasmid maintenance system antidote protein VapI
VSGRANQRDRPWNWRITANTITLRLSRHVGTSERFWPNLQARYDLERDRLSAALDQIHALASA